MITLCSSSGRILLEEREKAESQTNRETLGSLEGKVRVCQCVCTCGSLWSSPPGLKEREVWTLFLSTVSALQEELTTAQTRLQELQDDLTSAKQLHKALEDTQSQLRDRDAEIALIKTGSYFCLLSCCSNFSSSPVCWIYKTVYQQNKSFLTWAHGAGKDKKLMKISTDWNFL